MVSSDDNKKDPLAEFEEIDLDAELDDFIDEAEDGAGAADDNGEFSLNQIDEKRERAEHSPGVLSYQGKRYAVGLTWLTVDEDDDPALLKQRTKRLKADFHCLRNTVVAQQGFGYIEKGHKMGMNAAGALAADALIGEWHGVFVAENGWWYLAVHGDTVEPDGDIFFETEEDAYNHFLEMNDSYQWPRSYAPDAWNLPKTSGEIPLQKLFDDMPSVPLKPASMNAIFGGKRNKEIAIVLGGLFIGIVVFAIIAQQTIPNLIPEPKRGPGIQVAAPDRLQAPPREPQEEQEEKANITDRAQFLQPSLVLDACLKSFAELAHPFPGWRLDTMRCRNGMAEASWRRTSGNLESLRSNMKAFPFGVSHSFSGDNVFLATTVIKNLNRFQKETMLPERETALLALNDRFSSISNLSVKDVVPQSQQQRNAGQARNNRANSLRRTINNEQPEEQQKLTIGELPYLDVSMKFNTPPNLITHYFDIPGLVFDMIEWDINGQTWSYEARVILRYEAPQSVNTNNQATRR